MSDVALRIVEWSMVALTVSSTVAVVALVGFLVVELWKAVK